MAGKTASPKQARAPEPRRPASREALLRRLAEFEAENERLRRLSVVDPLTGLYNYRHFLEQLDVEMERVRRTAAPCSLLMLDIDHFKQVNDTHGHEAGNTVLREVAATVQAGTRAMDIACRYGGEEFAVILPATALDGAVHIAERIRLTLKERLIEHGSSRLKVTISAGAACFGYLDERSRAKLIELADSALYKAKKDGRDRVCSMSAPAPTTEVSTEEKKGLMK